MRGNSAKSLETLLRDEDLSDAFDALLDIPGLWDGMMFTTLHPMMAMKFHKVVMTAMHIAPANSSA